MYALVYIMDINGGGFEYEVEHYTDLSKTIERAKSIQANFCEDVDIHTEDRYQHKWNDDLENAFDEIDQCGDFVTESYDNDKLYITIKEVQIED